NSVSLLPRPRIRDITSDRFRLVNTSGIQARKFPIMDDSGFRRLIRIKLVVGDRTGSTTPERFARKRLQCFRPATPARLVTVWMKPGIQPRERTPCAHEHFLG